nr:retrotransposon protein, putative, Ty3-gypsy subclass [Tanacetum cinerariifolium]
MCKGEKFVWNEEREKSFEELKQCLVSALVLTLPSGSGGFQIYSDASKKGKANVVADALSRKSGMIAGIKVEEEIIRDLERLDIELYVKIEHQRASGLLQQLDIPIWKWDEISMDFVTGLPRTQRRHDTIWVVVDRLTKSAHFLPIRKDYSVSRL